MVEDKIRELRRHFEIHLGEVPKIVEISDSNYRTLTHVLQHVLIYTTPTTHSINIGTEKFDGMDMIRNPTLHDDQILFISENASRLYNFTLTPKYDKFLDKLNELN